LHKDINLILPDENHLASVPSRNPKATTGPEPRLTLEEALIRITGVMREVFDWDDLQFSYCLAPGSLEGWDSLSHIRLLRALEQEFGFRFTSDDLDNLDNAGEILEAVLRLSSK
jgi:acyl carrier protein